MSFLQYMMGRGIRRAAAETGGAGGLLGDLLRRRAASAVDAGALAAQLAFDAERRGELVVARSRYTELAQTKFAPRWAVQRAACVAATAGDLGAAADHYRRLSAGSAQDAFTRAHLLLAAGRPKPAAAVFRKTLAALLDPDAEAHSAAATAPSDRFPRASRDAAAGHASLDALLEKGADLLKAGRYVRARETFEHALALVDLLLSAQAGWIVAEARAGSTPTAALLDTLAPLAATADLLIRLLARTCLASTLAEPLRSRRLRDDLAVWATGSAEVTDLLRAEQARLARAAAAHAGHAELHYQLGLVSRALGDAAAADAAFRRVAALMPYYARAAARLAATLHASGRTDEALGALARAFDVPASVLKQYYALGVATADPKRFDHTVEALVAQAAPHAAADARANLALALSELGLLDEARRGWKHPRPAPAAA